MPKFSSAAQSVLRKEHLFFCFDVLKAKLSKDKISSSVLVPNGDEEYPLFVTWNIYGTNVSGKAKSRLRGCIGTFEATPLREGLEEYAIIAAFRDRRFDPISESELSRLECAVSLLTQFEDCEDYLDWEVGKHGIYIHLTPPGSQRTLTATYLPEVASDQGWTQKEAVDSAIQKSGWNGKVTDEIRQSLRVRRYQSEKASARYSEWKEARQ